MHSRSPSLIDTTDRISTWLRGFASPEENAEAASQRPRKRRRSNSEYSYSMERSRQRSPSKRPRVDCDEPITPTQSRSVSVVGSTTSVTSLTEKTTLSVRSSASRSSSPQRQITQLRIVHPPIFLHPLAAAAECVPHAVAPRIRALQTRLRDQLERGYIPACLRDALERNPTYKASLLFDPIEETAYYNNEEEDVDAGVVLDRVNSVFQGTQLCKEHTMDENAWCLHVVTPLLQLAILLYGHGRFRLESVQSQSIQPAYLSNIAPRPSPPLPIFRKTDFCLSYSHLHPPYASLYKTLRHSPISHTTDTYTEAAALFTGIEVKSPSGNLQEAQLQMSIWMAASLRKKAELAWSAFANGGLPHPPDHGTFIEPGITIVGTEHKVYYAYLSEPDTVDLSQDTSMSSCAVAILGNDTSLPSLDTSSIQGVLRVARLYGNLMEYAADENAETGYWGAFLSPILRSLADGVNVREQ
ncbi:hypothetical protein PMIN04_012504 [Paraphaeosphaeria minitans]|uniref:PD-(D/E)XK nuclease-like domain-containing protein n=1 Tax=Paraphaeosphaeria minitans TaxID=565426 RepID=A0A9P6KKY1_9PLEO|nr:hypothetical protein PMIN01_12203 [Paraphaeosphaeria minitans]